MLFVSLRDSLTFVSEVSEECEKGKERKSKVFVVNDLC